MTRLGYVRAGTLSIAKAPSAPLVSDEPVGPCASPPIATVARWIGRPVALSRTTPAIRPRGAPGTGGGEKSSSGSEVPSFVDAK